MSKIVFICLLPFQTKTTIRKNIEGFQLLGDYVLCHFPVNIPKIVDIIDNRRHNRRHPAKRQKKGKLNVTKDDKKYFVYFLRDRWTRVRYVGITSDLDRRKKEHSRGLLKKNTKATFEPQTQMGTLTLQRAREVEGNMIRAFKTLEEGWNGNGSKDPEKGLTASERWYRRANQEIETRAKKRTPRKKIHPDQNTLFTIEDEN